MNRATASRLARLEQKIAPPVRQLLLWDASSSDPSFDLDAEIVRFREEKGVTDYDELIVVGWLPPQV